jgi:hypothetical protein
MFSRKLGFIAVGATAVALAGGAYGIVSATTGNGSGTAAAAPPSSAPFAPHGGASNARSGPAAGGAAGTVDSVSASGFTISTAAGQEVTVDGTSIPDGAVAKGESVLVLGTTDGTTITASQVIVQPNDGGEPASSAAAVVPFRRGAPSTSKEVGQIPAGYSEGSGTIVSGTEANEATEAALAAYPGGVVDRVVKLSNGEYEVHNIGVSWPHHVFVSQSFEVVGAD